MMSLKLSKDECFKFCGMALGFFFLNLPLTANIKELRSVNTCSLFCRTFGQLRCTDSCLIDSTGCKYFTWVPLFQNQPPWMFLSLFSDCGARASGFTTEVPLLLQQVEVDKESSEGLILCLLWAKSWKVSLKNKKKNQPFPWLVNLPRRTALYYDCSVGCCTVTNTGGAGRYV